MAKSFKQLLGDDIRNTRTMLHEAIPITGTISSGTYTGATLDENIKSFLMVCLSLYTIIHF